MYALSLEPLSQLPQSHPSRSSESPELSSLWHVAASRSLSVLHVALCACQCCCCVVLSRTLFDPMNCSLPRLLCPRDFPGKNTGVGCHFLLQRIFLTQGWNPCLWYHQHWQVKFFFFYHCTTWEAHLYQCYSLNSSHPLLPTLALPLHPKVCSLSEYSFFPF